MMYPPPDPPCRPTPCPTAPPATPPNPLPPRALTRPPPPRPLPLARARLPPPRATERLLAVQAQLARPPFLALWSRVAGFRREALVADAGKRRIVRATA